VLNNWPDREAKAILGRCAEAARPAAARPAGRVVVLGGVSPDDAPRQLVMEMVLLGGKYRTISEFRELRACGWSGGVGRRAAAIRPFCRRVPTDVTATHNLHHPPAGCIMAAGSMRRYRISFTY